MATIDVTCPYCTTRTGLPARAMLASLDLTDTFSPLGELSWVCRICGHLTIADVEWRHLLNLVSAGVPLLDNGLDPSHDDAADVPSSGRQSHPEDPPSGARFTRDDLLTLHQHLETGTWWEQLGAPGAE